MNAGIRVFVNAAAVTVPAGSTVLDAVRAFAPGEATAVETGGRIATDSRGLPIDATTRLEAGAILRTIPRRDGTAADAEHLDDPA